MGDYWKDYNMTGDLDDKHSPPDYGKSRAALVPSLERRKEVLRLWDDQYPRLDRTSPENISGFWPLIAALDALAEMRKDTEWHPIGNCPVLDKARALLARIEGSSR